MARDYINIGPTPPDEKCAQVGADDYHAISKRECAAYIRQLRRVLGNEPNGARLSTKRFDHEYGSYLEVICYYDDTNEAALDYALKCESNEGPMKWDEIALQEMAEAAKGPPYIPGFTFGDVLKDKAKRQSEE